MSETQTSLIPDQIPNGIPRLIGLDKLDHVRIISPPPSAEFIKSIEQWGIQVPILLSVNGTGNVIDLVAGRRRVAAARIVCAEAGNSQSKYLINAIVYKDAWCLNHTLSILENQMRSDNPVSELHHILELEKLGYSEQAMAHATGIRLGTIRKRLRLKNLTVDAMTLLLAGRVSISTAEAMSRLSSNEQAELCSAEKRRITASDVRLTKMANRRVGLLAVSGALSGLLANTVPVARDAADDIATNLAARFNIVAAKDELAQAIRDGARRLAEAVT